MDHYFSAAKPVDEGMYADESGGNFDDYDDDMGVASGEGIMRIDSSSTTGFMSHHSHQMALMAAEKIVHQDFFNDFGDLFDADNFTLNATTAGHVIA